MALGRKILKYVALIFAALFFLFLGYMGYAYFSGGEANYVPPEIDRQDGEQKVMSDFIEIGNAIDAYNSVNLELPPSLYELKPDYIQEIPVEPVGKTQYIYERQGEDSYRLTITNPEAYDYEEFYFENGVVHRQ